MNEMEIDKVFCGDAYEYVKNLPDRSIDLVVTDPPYDFGCPEGGGQFGAKHRKHEEQLVASNGKGGQGIDYEKLLPQLDRVMKRRNIYIWCNKLQLRAYLDYYLDKNCIIDILTWHKTNPTPTTNNQYLHDTEYCIFARDKGVPMHGKYDRDRKWWVTSANSADKKAYGHPTIKPLGIIKNLIENSSNEGNIVFDPFMGSGTTAVASIALKRHYIGCEINEEYCKIIQKRIEEANEIVLDDKDSIFEQTHLFKD